MVSDLAYQDPELIRLQEAERITRERFERVSKFVIDAELIKQAEALWHDAESHLACHINKALPS
jgi:hypothetical protein